jgi:hypothetical protein
LAGFEHDEANRFAGEALPLQFGGDAPLRTVEEQRDILSGELVLDLHTAGSPILKVVAYAEPAPVEFGGCCGETLDVVEHGAGHHDGVTVGRLHFDTVAGATDTGQLVIRGLERSLSASVLFDNFRYVVHKSV